MRRLASALRGPGMAGVLGRGAAGHSLASGFGALALVGLQVLLANLMGAREFGYYIYALTWINVLGMVARLGMDTAQVRFVAAYRVVGDWPRLAGLLRFGDRLVVALGVGVALATAGVVWVLRGRLEPPLAETLWAAALVLPVIGLLKLRTSALQGLKHVALSPLPEGLARPLCLGLFAVVLYRLLGSLSGAQAMWLYLLATVLATLVAGGLRAARMPREVAAAEPLTEGKSWLRTSMPLSLVSGMRFLLNQTDILLVGLLVGTTAAGIYGVASRLSRLVSFGLMAGSSIAAPVISELHALGKSHTLQRAVTMTAWGTTGWALAAATALALGSPLLLGLFGEEFRAGAPILVILAVGQVINGSTGPVGHLLNMTGHERENAKILGWITGVNLVLSAAAIHAFGVLGAAVVTSLLVGVKNLWTWFIVRREMGINSSIFGSWSVKA